MSFWTGRAWSPVARRRRWWAVLVVIPLLGAAAPAASAAPPSAQVTAGVAADASPSNQRLQALLDELVANGVPGVLATVNDGTVTTRLASGVRGLGDADAMRYFARFRVGSVTKTFVATLVLQLEQQGRLRLDDPVERWLPGLVPNGNGITIRMLLNHTSGIFNYTDDPAFFADLARDPLRQIPPRDLVTLAVSHPPVFPPGTSWSYSNTNYIVAGLVVEAAGRAPVATQLARRILRPLGLRSTELPTTPRIGGYSARGYLPADNPFVPSPDGQPVDVTEVSPSWAWTAGAMTSTTGELARFYSALLRGRLLAPRQLEEMKDLVRLDPTTGYGLGLFRLRTACGDVWGHTGGVPGFETFAFADETGRRQAVLAVTMNSNQNTGPLFQLAAQTAVCQMFGRVPLDGAARRVVPQTSPVWSSDSPPPSGPAVAAGAG